MFVKPSPNCSARTAVWPLPEGMRKFSAVCTRSMPIEVIEGGRFTRRLLRW